MGLSKIFIARFNLLGTLYSSSHVQGYTKIIKMISSILYSIRPGTVIGRSTT